jgi:hypothetical protein
MPAVQIMVTQAGLDALVDAQTGATEAIQVTEIGLANAAFIAAPTLTALPHEFKRIGAVSGQAVSETVIHLTAQDISAETYTAYGFGLFLADGTLFAVYAQPDPIVTKVSIAAFLIAVDIAFLNAVALDIEFGDATFLYPPATETIQGVARIATNALADAGADDVTIMSPKKTKRVLDAFAVVLNAAWVAFQAAVNASIAAIAGRTITGTGLSTGGGDLTANRAIDTPEASGAELTAATAHKAASAWSHGQLARSRSANGYETLPGGLILQWGEVSTTQGEGTVSVTWPTAFPNACFPPVGIIKGAASGADMWLQAESYSTTGAVFRYQSTGSNTGYGIQFQVQGH